MILKIVQDVFQKQGNKKPKIINKKTHEWMQRRRGFTIQFFVLDNLLASACIQYATSALGRDIDVAEKISTMKRNKNIN